MVLASNRSQPGLRFVIGLSVIVVCIYAFYIIRARQVSPEVFLVPEAIAVQESGCKVVRLDDLLACIPTGMSFDLQADGLHFYQVEKKIKGVIQVMPRLPQEAAWRAALQGPLIKPFLRETAGMDTFTLMRTVLNKRYNPTLMGLKGRIIPSWMRGEASARIFMPDGMQAFCFYTDRQSLGIRFFKDRVLVITTTGELDRHTVVGLMAAVTHP
ncbi:MAG: hypothetical protein ABFD81_07435 [Syntrophaceae bacterium]